MILPSIENTNSLANSVFMQIRFSTAMVPTTFCKNLTHPLITCFFWLHITPHIWFRKRRSAAGEKRNLPNWRSDRTGKLTWLESHVFFLRYQIHLFSWGIVPLLFIAMLVHQRISEGFLSFLAGLFRGKILSSSNESMHWSVQFQRLKFSSWQTTRPLTKQNMDPLGT